MRFSILIRMTKRWAMGTREQGWLSSILVAMLCVLVLAGCEQHRHSISYSDLCGLDSERMGKMSEREVLEWIVYRSHNEPKPVILDPTLSSEMSGDAITAYMWTEKERTGIVYLRNGYLFRVSMDIKRGPMFGQVVSGLGIPDWVGRGAAMYGGHVVAFLELDYLELGISVETWQELTVKDMSRPHDKVGIMIRENMQVKSVSCYLPGLTLEEALRDIFFVHPDALAREVSRRIPWPGWGSWIPLDVP